MEGRIKVCSDNGSRFFFLLKLTEDSEVIIYITALTQAVGYLSWNHNLVHKFKTILLNFKINEWLLEMHPNGLSTHLGEKTTSFCFSDHIIHYKLPHNYIIKKQRMSGKFHAHKFVHVLELRGKTKPKQTNSTSNVLKLPFTRGLTRWGTNTRPVQTELYSPKNCPLILTTKRRGSSLYEY